MMKDKQRQNCLDTCEEGEEKGHTKREEDGRLQGREGSGNLHLAQRVPLSIPSRYYARSTPE